MKDCIEWKQCVSRAGYGVKRVGGKNVYAHRLAYCAAHGVTLGDIQGKEVTHICDNPRCVNPDHLRLGTHADNMADMVAKRRQPKGPNRKGTKLTLEQVREIRAAYARGERQPRKFARAFGISYYTVMRIAQGKRNLWVWDL